MPGRDRPKYLPGLSYGMSGGPMPIAWRQPPRAQPNRKIIACCVQCHEATMIWDYDEGKEYPIGSYYWRCICPTTPYVPNPVSASDLPDGDYW